MATSRWPKIYRTQVGASAETLFTLLADLPNYGRWLPGSDAYASTTDVESYPVGLGSRYHDGKPGEPGKEWWGSVTGLEDLLGGDMRLELGGRSMA
jgi:hypothetical protein